MWNKIFAQVFEITAGVAALYHLVETVIGVPEEGFVAYKLFAATCSIRANEYEF
jgi:hypothetical protein